jgi:hypothetical protein
MQPARPRHAAAGILPVPVAAALPAALAVFAAFGVAAAFAGAASTATPRGATARMLGLMSSSSTPAAVAAP